MQNQGAPRRGVGGADTMQQPNGQQQTFQQQYQQQQQLHNNNLDFSNFDFSAPIAQQQTQTPHTSTFDTNGIDFGLPNPQSQTYGLTTSATSVPSNELVRRGRSVAPTVSNAQQDMWNGFADVTNPNQAGRVNGDEEDLKARIARAKKGAQGKRKQIPPFVQKLWSFLESNNTDLIRWSDDGRSFIVLDEDEFARTMIPELFKHNNYASFVRQLNMYGFHKTVNITDGSLRQSEKARKGVKPPSMYSHEFFQRNQPELLWLIQKPAGKPPLKRKRDGSAKDQYDSDDDRQSPPPDGRSHEHGASSTTQDLAHIPRSELVGVRQELQKLQNQQKFISHMITQLKEQNDQFYRQATAFQALHDRHENSINAILSFLATFYNRSIEGNGAQNLVNMFASASQSQQQHGGVVEEFHDAQDTGENQQLQRLHKRPQLLLTGPEAGSQTPPIGDAVTQPNSARGSPGPDPGGPRKTSCGDNPRSDRVQSLDATKSPPLSNNTKISDLFGQTPEANEQMLSLMQQATQASTPTSGTPAFDFSALLGSTGADPLTQQQRDSVVQSFAKMHAGGGSHAMNQLATRTADVSSFANQIQQSNDALERLSNLQKQQDARVQELNRRLQPLSPTGAIPGLDTGNVDSFDLLGAPGEYDPNAFIDFDENTWGNDGGVDDGTDFDFGLDPLAYSSNNNMTNNSNNNNGTNNSYQPAGNGSSGAQNTQTQSSEHSRIHSVSSGAPSPNTDGDDDGRVGMGAGKKPRLDGLTNYG